MAPGSKTKRVSRSTRAGIIFPVTRLHRQLKSCPSAPKRITLGASVYLSSVLEYLTGKSISKNQI